MPGLGFPRWNIELLKVRNGQPGSWEMEWAADRFIEISKPIAAGEAILRQLKAG